MKKHEIIMRQSVLICISLICKAQDTVSSLMMHLSWICYIRWWFNVLIQSFKGCYFYFEV